MAKIEIDKDKGIRILSLDNGGAGSYAQLVILKEYTARLAKDLKVDECDVYPADHFELMGGVGFGGVIALLLGHLGMNVEQATEALLGIGIAVFPVGVDRNQDPETRLKNLRTAIGDVIKGRGLPVDAKMRDGRYSRPSCKVSLYATTSANLSHPTVFRTYTTRGSSPNPTIVEALCATMATPSLFPPVKIGPHMREQNFVGGPLGANNPTRELLKEACTVFESDSRIAQIISIGTGRPSVLSLNQVTSTDGVGRLVEEVSSDCERVAHELSARLFVVDAYLRLNVDRGMEHIGMADWDDLGAIESHTSAYLETPAILDVVEGSLKRIQERVGTFNLGQLTHSSEIKATVKSAPAVSPYYILRQKEYHRMVHYLVRTTNSGQRIFAITGMGGCGKTQMASYFLRENKSLFNPIVFVDASSQNSVKADLQAWARSLGDGHQQDVWEDALRFLARDSHNGKWTLILDNADDPELDLVPFLPKCHHGTVIVTSRNREAGYLANTYHLELGKMEPEEALSALMQAAGRQLPLPVPELECAYKLMEELGYLALALVQAGTYCHQLSSTVDGVPQPYPFIKYLDLFHSQRAVLMQRVGPATLDGYQRGVYTTLDLSYQAIPPNSKDFLHIVSNFHYSDIPVPMFEFAAKRHFKDPKILLPRPNEHKIVLSRFSELLCSNGIWNEQEAIQRLRSFSLISTTIVGDTLFLQLHPLVQAWARDKQSNSPEYRTMAGQVLTSCCFEDNIAMYRYLMPHISEMWQLSPGSVLHINDQVAIGKVLLERGQYDNAELLFAEALRTLQGIFQEETTETLWVAGRLAGVFSLQGHWNKAETLYLKIIEQWGLILGREHPGMITAAANLASTYRSQGRWDEAGKLQLDVLEQRRRILGLEHPHTITAAANLASTYRSQGRWDEAGKLELDVLEQSRRILGLEHPHTITAAANLASTYRSQGRWDEAGKLELDVLEQSRRIFGLEHPDTITAAANLASTYRSQGRWDEAGKLELDVLEQSRRILGLEHPHTITAAANLACTYYSQGRWDEAGKLQLDVLEQRRRILGLEHPHTITAAANLASTYRSQGRWDEAGKLELDVLEQSRRIFGLEHPDTITAAANLASTYRSQGRWDEAGKLELDVLEQSRRILGLEHPHTIIAAANLASTYRSQGRWDEAGKLELDVLEQSRRILGLEHPHTIIAAANLASTYRSQGRWDEAGKLELDVLEQRRRILGLEHPHTITAAASLASTYYSQGRWDEARKLQLDVLEQSRRILGLEHPHTITAAGSLASTYRSQGRWDEAGKLELDVLEQSRRILGLEHPDTIIAAANLASTYRSQGRWDEAGKLELDVLEQSRRIFGLEHPHTITAAASLASTYRSQGRWDEAGKLELDVLEQSRRIFGLEHPHTITAAASLASTYYSQGRWDEARKLELDVLEQSRRILGLEHPHTITAAANLASTYYSQGRWDEAGKLQLDVLEQRRRILGLEHPQTISAAANLGITYYRQEKWQDAEPLLASAAESAIRMQGTQHPNTQNYIAHLVNVYNKLGKFGEAEAMEKLILSTMPS